MLHLQVTKTTMELLPLVCVSLLTWSGTTFADENVIKMVETEDSDVILPCSLSTTNIKQELFDWKKDGQKEVFMYDKGTIYSDQSASQDEQFKGRVSHFPEQLEFGNASIIIRNAKVTDSGSYTCDFPHLQPGRRSNIELVVDPILKDRTAENIPGATRKPFVTILKETKDGMLLQCEVQGASPKPEVEWKDSDGNKLPAEKTQDSGSDGRYDIILQTTVNKADTFRCVATQKEISHMIYSEIYVPIKGAAPEPSVTMVDQMEDWALLQCAVRGAFPKPKLHWQDRAGKVLHAKEPKESERGGRYDIILQTTVTKTDNYSCVATQTEISHQTDAKIFVYIHGSSAGLVVTAALGPLVVVVLGIVLQ